MLQFDLKAASGAIKAVTSVTIRNGPEGSVWDYMNDTGPVSSNNDRVIPDKLPEDTDHSSGFTWNMVNGFGMHIIASKVLIRQVVPIILHYLCLKNLCNFKVDFTSIYIDYFKCKNLKKSVT